MRKMKQKQQTPAKPKRLRLTLTQMALPGVVLILVGLILLVKTYRATTEAAVAPSSQSTPTLPAAPAGNESKPVIQADKEPQPATPTAPTADMPPEAQLDYFMAVGQPTFAFFHSNNCIQCIKMIEVVDQVYPDFAGEVALVDVNVYDQENQNLLRRAGIRAIPTMIFIDRAGNGQGYMGVMETGAFREQLQQLAEE